MALNILLTNDDGYNAAGIQSMYAALLAAGFNVHIVAPLANQSAQGSSLGGTAALASPIAVNQVTPGNYTVDGRPAIVTKTALDDLYGGQAPDVVISGTNLGDNVGESENISGTVNAAVAALIQGVPAIAVSAASAGGSVGYTYSFANADAIVVNLLNKLQAERAPGAPLLPTGQGLSINVPSGQVVNGVAVTQIDAESNGYYPVALQKDGLYNSNFVAAGPSEGHPLSEGSQFLAGNATITPIDGDWGATDQVRADLQARLSTTLAGTPPAPTGKPLNIMLVNDDGYQAPGLQAMRTALLAAGYNVTVVAPQTDQSGTGSALTLQDYSVTQYAQGYYVNATPTTTVETGLDALLTGANRPDLVISGTNAGANVGLQAVSSGTISAAVAAIANYGIPAIAVSAGTGTVDPSLYTTAANFTVSLIQSLQATEPADGTLLPAGTGLDVNLPNNASATNFAFTDIDSATNSVLGIAAASATTAQLSVSGPTSSPNPNSEGDAFNNGQITISPLDANFTSNDQALFNQVASLENTTLGQDGPGFADFTGSRSGYNVGFSNGQVVVTTASGLDDTVVPASKLTFAEGTLTAAAATNQGLEIGGLYAELFGRSADAGGFSFWVGQAEQGASISAIASGFINSNEFAAGEGKLSNTAFVNALYTNGLDRPADSTGLNFWTSQLNNGASRANVAAAFLTSQEFSQTQTQPLFTSLAKIS